MDVSKLDKEIELLKEVSKKLSEISVDTYQKLIDSNEKNVERFMVHLTKISNELGIDWWDGDFPIDEVIDEIKKLKDKK